MRRIEVKGGPAIRGRINAASDRASSSATRRGRCQSTENRLGNLISPGDAGGIVCHIVPKEGHDALIVWLTHERAHRSLPFAAAVFDYQKHRVKKLKKRNGT
jgi:hypothetical protein